MYVHRNNYRSLGSSRMGIGLLKKKKKRTGFTTPGRDGFYTRLGGIVVLSYTLTGCFIFGGRGEWRRYVNSGPLMVLATTALRPGFRMVTYYTSYI